MTILKNSAEILIDEFGEEVTVVREEDSPDDPDDPIYFDESSTVTDEFTEKVRLFENPDEELLNSYGFEQDSDTVIYTTKDVIQTGDIILYRDSEFVVSSTSTKQIGDGPYRYVHSIMRRK